MVTFKHSSAPLLASDLDQVERQFGFAFPSALRDLYLRYNGGRPDKDRFVDDSGACIVAEFLAIKHGKASLTLEATMLRVRHLLPDHLVPFAVDQGGNFFCFSTRESDPEAVFLLLT